MPEIHLIEGPVGAGKSTYATALAARISGVHIALDDWFASLFSPDRPETDAMAWYIEHKARLVALIWRHSRRIIEAGGNIVLELGLIQRESRLGFYGQLHDEGFQLSIHVLDAPLEVRRERVHRRNRERGATYAMQVPDAVFDLASRMWEPVDAIERAHPGVSFLFREAADSPPFANRPPA